jgi:hypothetical protein
VMPFPVYDTHKRHYELQPAPPAITEAPTTSTFKMPVLP